MSNSRLTQHRERHLREVQLKQVALLRWFDGFCKSHGLTYWLDGGTLLGAVRHGGFIPWDDDLDVGMPLADLKRFLLLAPGEIPEDIVLQHKGSDPGYPFPFVKLRDTNSFYVEYSDDFRIPYAKGIYMDIFAFIPYPSISRKVVRFFTRRLVKCIGVLRSPRYLSWRTMAEWGWCGLQYLLLRPVWGGLMLFKGKRNLSNELPNNGYGIMHRTAAVFPVHPISFEGDMFSGPADPDAYLTDLYNRYMELPPPEKRQSHAVYINPCLDTPAHCCRLDQ